MEAILVARGVGAGRANTLVTAYAKQKRYADEEQLTPAPTFRDLLRVASRVMKGQLVINRAESPRLELQSLFARQRADPHSVAKHDSIRKNVGP